MSTLTVRRAVLATLAVLLLSAVYLLGTWTASSRASGATRTIPSAVNAAGANDTSMTAGAAGITVTGVGEVTGTPDTLLLRMGVQFQATGVDEALKGANAAATAVQNSLRGHGVADKDLQTSNLSIQPRENNSGGTATITGYQVSETLTATLRPIGTAGAAITAAAAAGGNSTRIESISLDLSDTSSLVAAARDRAFAQAKAKAGQYARAAGINLGDAVAINETTTGSTPTTMRAAESMTAAVGSVPIATGSQKVGVTVTVVFAIG